MKLGIEIVKIKNPKTIVDSKISLERIKYKIEINKIVAENFTLGKLNILKNSFLLSRSLELSFKYE